MEVVLETPGSPDGLTVKTENYRLHMYNGYSTTAQEKAG